jgi:Restriction endonuclease
MWTLYLIRANAAGTYMCDACGAPIPRGRSHFRHDPHYAARYFRGEKSLHLCVDCVLGADPPSPEKPTGRIRMPAVQVMQQQLRLEPVVEVERWQPRIKPIRIEAIGIAQSLATRLLADPTRVHELSADQFEEFICDRLYAMGLEPRRAGATAQKDGGVDIVFWPRERGAFPFLGAAQVKHHRDPSTSEGPGSVRDFAGAIAGRPFSAGIFVTNTSFTPDARWFADRQSGLVRLRDYCDLKRWMLGQFDDDAEWREMPSEITLCPGVVVKIRE